MKLKRLIIVTTIIVIAVMITASVYAQSTQNITATVKLSICGNGVVEGIEDCELGVPIIDSCSSIGFDSGTLKCDISCEYDLRSCKPKASSGASVDTTNIESKDSLLLPQIIRVFDTDKNGYVSLKELSNLLTTWIGSWKKSYEDKKYVTTCDLNNDKQCDISDFSILLFYSK